ncbi:hypothetical protein [Paraburkholderia solisilvae]|uniref:hypothetical protein n=1 Tax=Paraburkholderia solisilvae TaxID=624376 RepID=UPI00158223B4|nr:hypothetical protein [Paraburkholderia solisilvae]
MPAFTAPITAQQARQRGFNPLTGKFDAHCAIAHALPTPLQCASFDGKLGAVFGRPVGLSPC